MNGCVVYVHGDSMYAHVAMSQMTKLYGYHTLKMHGHDSIPMLAPSHIDYPKVDLKCIHWVIRQGLFLAKRKELYYIKKSFAIF